MKFIDADAKILAQFYDEEHEEWEVRELTVADYLSYSDTAIPFVDAVIVKHGTWIKMSDRDGIYWACSECGEDIPRVPHYNPEFDLFPRLESIDKTNYCPNCGARMDR